MSRITPGIVLILILIACASAQQGGELPVTQDEIAGAGSMTVYDALRNLRPSWLRTIEGPKVGVVVRGRPPPRAVDQRCSWLVYVGERGYEGDYLRRINIDAVREIRLIPPRRRLPDGLFCQHDHSVIHVVPKL